MLPINTFLDRQVSIQHRCLFDHIHQDRRSGNDTMPIEISTVHTLTPSSIFQQNSLQDILELSNTLTTISKAKHDELRTLVAFQYRDLLSTADQIIEMNDMSKGSDKQLYELSFLNTPKLNNNLSIERNIDRYWSEHPVKQDDKINRVKSNAELFLIMSELLNLSSGDSMDTIRGVLSRLPVDQPWFKERRDVIDIKLEELCMVVMQKMKSMSLDELVKVNSFVMRTQWFDKSSMEKELYECVLQRTTLENLKSVLMKFEMFKKRLQKRYTDESQRVLSHLEELLQTVEDKGEKLDLYSMDLEDAEYLTKIQYLSHGLLFEKYQQIDDCVHSCLMSLKYVEVVDSATYTEHRGRLDAQLQNFTQHAQATGNTALCKYLGTV